MLSEGNIIRVVLSAQDVTERRHTEEQLRTLTQELDNKVRERTEELQKANQQLRGLSQQLVDLQEDQIKYLAREIHDSVGQNLTAININLTLLQKTLPENYPDAIKSRLVDTSQIVEETVVRMRNIMAEFLPPMLESYGLSTALVWYGQQFTTRMNIPVLVNDHSLDVFRLPPQTEIGFFRIVQEALNNIAKYAQATQVNIDLKGDGDHVLMTITDNGMGFDAKVVFAEQSTHWGFAIMRERARALDASFNIESAPGKGTKVIVRIAR
jgi:signal transduction histidine kinase